jgi:hypothetical protein
MNKITKKSIKSTLFLLFVLFLFSSCVKNVHNCKFFPDLREPGEVDSVSKKNLLKSLNEARKTLQFKCNF